MPATLASVTFSPFSRVASVGSPNTPEADTWPVGDAGSRVRGPLLATSPSARARSMRTASGRM